MKLLSVILLLLVFYTTQSQTGTDSFSASKTFINPEVQEKISSKQISLDKKKLELGELQKKLADKTVETNAASRQADASIDNNVNAAEKLQKKSPKKKYAKRAKKAAKKAQRDAHTYRSSKSELKHLRKSIEKKEKAISREERELAELKASAT